MLLFFDELFIISLNWNTVGGIEKQNKVDVIMLLHFSLISFNTQFFVVEET